MRSSLFSDRPENCKLGRRQLILASCKGSLNSVQQFQRRGRKYKNLTTDDAYTWSFDSCVLKRVRPSLIPDWSPAYGVFISQLKRYARACSSYECFILRAARLSSKLLGQGYVRERLKSSLRKFYGRYRDLIKHYEVPPLSQMLHDILRHGHLQWHPQLIRHYTNLWTYHRTGPYYRFWPYYQIAGGFHRTLQRVRLANRGRLLLRTPGPVPFGTCICSYVETILSWTCHVYGPFEFRTSLGTSILLIPDRL